MFILCDTYNTVVYVYMTFNRWPLNCRFHHIHIHYTRESKKVNPTLAHNFVERWTIFKFLQLSGDCVTKWSLNRPISPHLKRVHVCIWIYSCHLAEGRTELRLSLYWHDSARLEIILSYTVAKFRSCADDLESLSVNCERRRVSRFGLREMAVTAAVALRLVTPGLPSVHSPL